MRIRPLGSRNIGTDYPQIKEDCPHQKNDYLRQTVAFLACKMRIGLKKKVNRIKKNLPIDITMKLS